MGGSLLRISARTSSVGTPRSMSQTLSALPYWVSIFFTNAPMRGFVGGIAAQHLVSQWQALRSDDQGDDALHAVGAFITAVAEAALVAFRKGWIAFKIG